MVKINYSIRSIQSGDLIYKSQSRGFANYDVSKSEYTNTIVKNEAVNINFTLFLLQFTSIANRFQFESK